MNAQSAVHWSDLWTRCLTEPHQFQVIKWVGVPALCVLAILAPGTFVAAAAALGLVALLWRSYRAAGLLLIALMGNVKINYYAGLLTVFPEYAVILVAGVVWLLRQAERPQALPEPEVLGWFSVWTVAGLTSATFAYNIPSVFARAGLLPIAAAVFALVVLSVRNRHDLDRAMRWLGGSAMVVAAYAIVQIVGIYFNVDTSLGFLRKWGNPEFEYSVGAPVLHRLSSTFRANSFFNDPNILGGYLAAVIPVFAARVLAPGVLRSRWRLGFEAITLVMLTIALILTLSRSGFLGTLCGLATAMAFLPVVGRSPRFWIGFGLCAATAIAVTAAIGVDALILLGRLTAAIEGTEFSARVHQNLFVYGLELFARHPVTGVGLHNFAEYYQREIDALTPNMMAHNMWMTNLTETGLFGFGAFLMICRAVVRRPWRVLRAGPAGLRDVSLFPTIAGLFGGLVAVAVTNLFYDFSLRSFVWGIAGLTVAAAGLVRREREA